MTNWTGATFDRRGRSRNCGVAEFQKNNWNQIECGSLGNPKESKFGLEEEEEEEEDDENVHCIRSCCCERKLDAFRRSRHDPIKLISYQIISNQVSSVAFNWIKFKWRCSKNSPPSPASGWVVNYRRKSSIFKLIQFNSVEFLCNETWGRGWDGEVTSPASQASSINKWGVLARQFQARIASALIQLNLILIKSVNFWFSEAGGGC